MGGVAHWDDIGVAVETEGLRVALRAPARDEVRDAATVGTVAFEPGVRQQRLEKRDRARILRRDGGALHEAAGEVGGVGHGPTASAGRAAGQWSEAKAGDGL